MWHDFDNGFLNWTVSFLSSFQLLTVNTSSVKNSHELDSNHGPLVSEAPTKFFLFNLPPFAVRYNFPFDVDFVVEI